MPSRKTTSIDPARCPICGQPNQCAMELARASGQALVGPCWCASAHIDAALLARVPAAARRRACICPRCASTQDDAPPRQSPPARTGRN